MDESLKWHQQLFIIILYLSWILLIIISIWRNNNLLIISLIKQKSLYFSTLLSKLEVIIKKYNIENILFIFEQFLKIYIGVLLVYKFNPWSGSYKYFKKFDQRIAFHAGIFLLISTILTSILHKYLLELEKKFTIIISNNK
jgi:hypothetical protein